MRIIALATLVLFAFTAGTADARRKATKSEKRKIARVMEIPPKCSVVYVSTVNERWARLHYNHRKINVSPCDEYVADGIAILRKVKRKWRFVTAGSSYDCPIEDVPERIRKDLKIRCDR